MPYIKTPSCETCETDVAHSVSSCAAAGGDVPGQGFHWAPAVTAAVAGPCRHRFKEKHIYTLGVTAPARMQINTRISNQYR